MFTFGRSIVVMSDGSNIRADAITGARKVAGADFGASFMLLQNTSSRPPNGQWDPRQGTQVVTGAGWYKIAVPGVTEPAYISRDLVVVQQ